MNEELEQIIGKARKFRALRRAKARVARLERELRGEPVKPDDAPFVPEFLRVRLADRADSETPYMRDKSGTRAVIAKTALRLRAPTFKGTSAEPRPIRLTEAARARSRHLLALLPEPPT
jgi:hypothetical protein